MLKSRIDFFSLKSSDMVAAAVASLRHVLVICTEADLLVDEETLLWSNMAPESKQSCTTQPDSIKISTMP